MRKLDLYSLILGLLIGAAASGWTLVAYTESHPKLNHAWYQSSVTPPPSNGTPFYGVWLRSGRLDQCFSRRIGNRYFTYIPGSSEASTMLGYQAPEYWVELPGAAQ